MGKKKSKKKPAPHWKLVEKVVALLEQSIAPTARVRHNVKLPEVISGNLRQCDTVIEQGEEPRITRSIVEVQKRKRRVDVGTFDGWYSKMRKVGAQHLICVSALDYPKSIKDRVAKEIGPTVRLLRLRDLKPSESPIGLTQITMRFPKARLDLTRRVTFDLANPDEWAGDIKLSSNSKVFRRNDSDKPLSVLDLLREAAESMKQPVGLERGSHHGAFVLPTKATPLFIVRDEKNHRITRLEIPSIVDVDATDVPVCISSYDQIGHNETLAWIANATANIAGEEVGVRLTFSATKDGYFPINAIQFVGTEHLGFLVFQGRKSSA